MKFQPQLDVVGLALSFASILTLLYFGLTTGSFAPDYWVAFAFWFIGFFGMIYIVKRNKNLNLGTMFKIGVGTGLILICFYAVSMGASFANPQDIWLSSKFISFAIGVSEELFFGVFILSALISWFGIHPLLAIGVTSGVHAVYHVPNLGAQPVMLAVFFTSFFLARTVYVYVAPYVGVLLGAHGFWNFIV